ncbi:MAG: hypothetical protein ABIP54_04150 [Candidatus Andersenbacteria bacterium]
MEKDDTRRGEPVKEEEREEREYSLITFGIVMLFMALLIGFNSYSNWVPTGTTGIAAGTAWNASQVGVIVMVKNEELILERLLKSVAPYGEWLFVCDTGSTDGTQDKVNYWTASPSNRAHFRFIGPFHDFETSRNLCMDAARTWIPKQVEWLLLPDADFELKQQEGLSLTMPHDFDLNIIQIRLPPEEGHKGSLNALPLLVRATTFFGNCRYRLWTHEVLDCCNATTKTGYFAPLYWIDHSDGASRSNKLERDITLLEEWIYHYNRTLASSPTERRPDLYGRALYYLARAHEDAGHPEQALQLYHIHQLNQPWTNYQFQGRYRTAIILLTQYRNQGSSGSDWRPIEAAFLDAYGGADGYFRKEVLYYLMWLFQELRQWNRCILYASAGLAAPPVDYSRMPLFLEPEKHESALFQKGWDYCVYHSKNSPLGQ